MKKYIIMCPERCKHLILIEDDEANIDLMQHYLEKGGHQVMHVATTMKEATQLIDSLPTETEAVIIDANISPYIKDGSEGILLANHLHDTHPDVPVVGFSINEFPKEAPIFIDASPTGFSGLSHIIDTLPKRGKIPLTAAPVR